MARKRKTKKLSERQLTTKLVNLIKRHGKVQIIFNDDDPHDNEYGTSPSCGCILCDSCKKERESSRDINWRRRIINKEGCCEVSYKSNGYPHWSGYSQSCFMDDYWDGMSERQYDNYMYGDKSIRDKYTVRKTLRYMFKHDRYDDIFPVAIKYGKRFSKEIKLTE